MQKISVIVPCYNEEAGIKDFYEELIKVLDCIKDNYTYEIIFIDDGSKDKTMDKLKQLSLRKF